MLALASRRVAVANPACLSVDLQLELPPRFPFYLPHLSFQMENVERAVARQERSRTVHRLCTLSAENVQVSTIARIDKHTDYVHTYARRKGYLLRLSSTPTSSRHSAGCSRGLASGTPED